VHIEEHVSEFEEPVNRYSKGEINAEGSEEGHG